MRYFSWTQFLAVELPGCLLRARAQELHGCFLCKLALCHACVVVPIECKRKDMSGNYSSCGECKVRGLPPSLFVVEQLAPDDKPLGPCMHA